MSKVPLFSFDFSQVAGMPVEEGVQVLFKQLADHYNKHITPAPILFGGQKLAGPVAPATLAAPAESPKPTAKPTLKADTIDTETVTPNTVPLKRFTIRDSASGEGKVIIGTAVDGQEITDTLLPGYDQEPYGRVVSGEEGRYNLKP